MGTRARVAIENDDHSYTSIYTHWDGYPSHHGPILLGHYNTADKVRELLALGDLSSLGEKIGRKHDFDARDEEADGLSVCTAYGRDRGETGVSARQSLSIGELSKLTQDTGGEYLYLFKDGAWYVAEGGVAFFGMPADKEPGALQPLQDVVKKEE
jgi:hypothetical protein